MISSAVFTDQILQIWYILSVKKANRNEIFHRKWNFGRLMADGPTDAGFSPAKSATWKTLPSRNNAPIRTNLLCTLTNAYYKEIHPILNSKFTTKWIFHHSFIPWRPILSVSKSSSSFLTFQETNIMDLPLCSARQIHSKCENGHRSWRKVMDDKQQRWQGRHFSKNQQTDQFLIFQSSIPLTRDVFGKKFLTIDLPPIDW